MDKGPMPITTDKTDVYDGMVFEVNTRLQSIQRPYKIEIFVEDSTEDKLQKEWIDVKQHGPYLVLGFVYRREDKRFHTVNPLFRLLDGQARIVFFHAANLQHLLLFEILVPVKYD